MKPSWSPFKAVDVPQPAPYFMKPAETHCAKERAFRQLVDHRERFESSVLSVRGVVGMGVGLAREGNLCLKIYATVPPDLVDRHFPSELTALPYEIEVLFR